jgi:transcriptional regulator with XRE-family HTH domain
MTGREEHGQNARGISRVLGAELKRRNLKETDLASALGVSTNTVSSWVTGRFAPSHRNAGRIASELEISIDVLYGRAARTGTPAEQTGGAEDVVRQLAQLQSAQKALRELSEAVPPLLDVLTEAQRLAESWAADRR